MNIIKRDNQRAVIHLSRIAGTEVFLARAVVFAEMFNGSYTSHLVGIKRLNAEEADELRLNKDTLAQFNITLIDADASAAEIVVATSLLGFSRTASVETPVESFVFIPSPYASKAEILEAFFSTQKTRAPTFVQR